MDTLKLSSEEVEYIVAFILNFEREDIPETLREDILPKLQEFLEDNY